MGNKIKCRAYFCIGLVLNIGACQSSSMSEVERLLSAVDSEYRLDTSSGEHSFVHKERIEAALATADLDKEVMLQQLVDCLDESTPSSIELDGVPVRLGNICYEALSQQVYYEAVDEEGDIVLRWPGHVLPTSTAEEMKQAQDVWNAVLESKAYVEN